jgi:excinuclease UvrABC helicase subunit UvrB
MAVRYGCPIYTYDFILDAAGVRIEDPQPGESESEEVQKESKPKRRRRGYSEYSLDDLTAMLDKVIGEEDYEKAAKIRDEINKRKEEGS